MNVKKFDNQEKVLSSEELLGILKEYDSEIEIIDYYTIIKDTRNTNLDIMTNKGVYLLKVCRNNYEEYISNFEVEKSIYDLIGNKVNMPRLLATIDNGDFMAGLYDFIEGSTLNYMLYENHGKRMDIIIDIASSLAKIHNIKTYAKMGFLDSNLRVIKPLPKFETWYQLFLTDEVSEVLGKSIVSRIQELLDKSLEDMEDIDTDYCLVHGDYSINNMIYSAKEGVTFLDWEFSSSGHRYADIGQFLRESSLDHQEQDLFFSSYQRESKIPLKANWIQLAKLRDLANLLQMIGKKIEGLSDTANLRGQIDITLTYLEKLKS